MDRQLLAAHLSKTSTALAISHAQEWTALTRGRCLLMHIPSLPPPTEAWHKTTGWLGPLCCRWCRGTRRSSCQLACLRMHRGLLVQSQASTAIAILQGMPLMESKGHFSRANDECANGCARRTWRGINACTPSLPWYSFPRPRGCQQQTALPVSSQQCL